MQQIDTQSLDRGIAILEDIGKKLNFNLESHSSKTADKNPNQLTRARALPSLSSSKKIKKKTKKEK